MWNRSWVINVAFARSSASALFCLLLVSGCQSNDDGALPYLVGYDFESGSAEGLSPKTPESWEVAEEDGSMVYRLLEPGEFGEIRAPSQWSVLSEYPVGAFEFSGRFKCHTDPEILARDLLVLFNYQDPTHFYYVHFSASSDNLHNIIGLVNGADRVKISQEPPGESVYRLTDSAWHDFKVTFDPESGEIAAFIDDMESPILTATDTTLLSGFVGVGSFDDTGSFDDLRLWGEVLRR